MGCRRSKLGRIEVRQFDTSSVPAQWRNSCAWKFYPCPPLWRQSFSLRFAVFYDFLAVSSTRDPLTILTVFASPSLTHVRLLIRSTGFQPPCHLALYSKVPFTSGFKQRRAIEDRGGMYNLHCRARCYAGFYALLCLSRRACLMRCKRCFKALTLQRRSNGAIVETR